MKKILLAYYTLEGNTGYVAERLAQAPEIAAERLIVDREPPRKGFGKFLIGGRSALAKSDPGLHELSARLPDYSELIIAFPVWAGTFPPAIGAFLKKYPLRDKRIWIIACSASGNAAGAVARISGELAGNTIEGSLSLTDPGRRRPAEDEKISAFLALIRQAQ